MGFFRKKEEKQNNRRFSIVFSSSLWVAPQLFFLWNFTKRSKNRYRHPCFLSFPLCVADNMLLLILGMSISEQQRGKLIQCFPWISLPLFVLFIIVPLFLKKSYYHIRGSQKKVQVITWKQTSTNNLAHGCALTNNKMSWDFHNV